MKILHTSDWHLGHTLYEHERTAEMQSFLDQLVTIAKEQCPDALLVCGDVYDRAQPSNVAHEMYISTMLRLRRECPEMQIIVTAGNHDSKSALQTEGLIWQQMDVRVVGQPTRNETGDVNWEEMIVPIKRQQEVVGYVVAVPHIYDLNYPCDDPSMPRELRKKAFFDRLNTLVKERNEEGLPVVMMAHLWVDGSDTSGHDFGESVGGLDATPVAIFGSEVDYIALGHIHGGQRVSEHPLAYYCGSPLPTSFDERGLHEVLLVDLQPSQQPAVKHFAIHNPKPLLTVPAQPATFEKAMEELSLIGSDQQGYLRLNLLRDGSRPSNFVERITAALQDKALCYCTIAMSNRVTTEPSTSADITFDEMQTKSPLDIATLFYRQVTGQEALPEQWHQMIVSLLNPNNL